MWSPIQLPNARVLRNRFNRLPFVASAPQSLRCLVSVGLKERKLAERVLALEHVANSQGGGDQRQLEVLRQALPNHAR